MSDITVLYHSPYCDFSNLTYWNTFFVGCLGTFRSRVWLKSGCNKKERTEPRELGQYAICRKTWKQKKGKKEKFEYWIYSISSGTDRGKTWNETCVICCVSGFEMVSVFNCWPCQGIYPCARAGLLQSVLHQQVALAGVCSYFTALHVLRLCTHARKQAYPNTNF